MDIVFTNSSVWNLSLDENCFKDIFQKFLVAPQNVYSAECPQMGAPSIVISNTFLWLLLKI